MKCSQTREDDQPQGYHVNNAPALPNNRVVFLDIKKNLNHKFLPPLNALKFHTEVAGCTMNPLQWAVSFKRELVFF